MSRRRPDIPPSTGGPLSIPDTPRPKGAGKKIEEPFGWAKTVGGMAQTLHRGLDRVRAQFTMTMAACNLARLPKLLAA